MNSSVKHPHIWDISWFIHRCPDQRYLMKQKIHLFNSLGQYLQLTFAAMTLEGPLLNFSIQILFDFFLPWKFSLLKFIADRAFIHAAPCWSFWSKGCSKKNFYIFSIIATFQQSQTFHIWTNKSLEYFWEKSMWNIKYSHFYHSSFSWYFWHIHSGNL